MIKGILQKHNITEEQFEELLNEYDDKQKSEYYKHLEGSKVYKKEYDKYKDQLDVAKVEIDKLSSTSINKDVSAYAKIAEKEAEIIKKQVDNKREMLGVCLLENQLELLKGQLELTKKALTIIVDIIVNMKDEALNLI